MEYRYQKQDSQPDLLLFHELENGARDNQVVDVAELSVPIYPRREQAQNRISDYTLLHQTAVRDHTYESPKTVSVLSTTTNSTPRSLQVHTDDSSITTSTHDEADNDVHSPSPTTKIPGRVRFRSRVRITSGLHHHRHRKRDIDDSGHVKPSIESSLSSSPSSSISAPLRSRTDDESRKQGWGPLGQRVSLLASDSQRRRWAERRERRRRDMGYIPGDSHHGQLNERSALMGSTRRLAYPERDDAQDDDSDAEDAARAIDLVFGKWPNRLLNHHWWWWQLEPIICCHCVLVED